MAKALAFGVLVAKADGLLALLPEEAVDEDLLDRRMSSSKGR